MSFGPAAPTATLKRSLVRTLSCPAARFLASLMLLTPLLAGLHLLTVRAAPLAEPTVVTQVVEVPVTQLVEVPRTVYVEVPVRELIIVREPAGSAGPTDEVATFVPSEAESLPADEVASPPAPADDATAAAELDGAAPDSPPVPVAAARPAIRLPARIASLPRAAPAPPPALEEEEPAAAPNEEPPAATQALLAEPTEPPPAPVDPNPPTSDARRELDDFYARTEATWSREGYSSAEEMREALGNSQTGWLNRAREQVADEAVARPAGAAGPPAEGQSPEGPVFVAEEPTVEQPEQPAAFFAEVNPEPAPRPKLEPAEPPIDEPTPIDREKGGQ